MNPQQLRDYIIRPVVGELPGESENAVELLMLTAAVESNLGYYVRQVRGPALGIYQMEPATYADIWDIYLFRKPVIVEVVRKWGRTANDMIGCLYFATAMARIHYLRKPEPLPDKDDVLGMAQYWKDHYNTHLGRGTTEKAAEAYHYLVMGE